MTARRWGWRDLPLWLKGTIVVGIPVLPLVITASLYQQSQQAHLQAQQWVVHTWEVRYGLQHALTLVSSAETTVRGFVLIRDRAWLAQYEQTVAELSKQVETLEATARAADHFTPQLGELRTLVDTRLRLMAMTVARADAAGEPVEDLVRRGEETSREIRRIIGLLLVREEALLAERLELAAATRTRVSATMYGGTAAGVLGGLIAALLFSRGIGRRLERVAESAVLAGEPDAPPADEGADEIGRLSRTLTTAIRSRVGTEKELRQAEQFVSSVLDNIPESIVVKEATTLRYVWFNRAAEEMIGLTRQEVIGRTDADLFSAEQAARANASDREVAESGTIDVREQVVQTPSGERILQMKKFPLPGADGRPRHLVGIAHDMTARRQDELTLTRALTEAERANHSKSEFLSRMSHDLRTPLNAVIGFAQTLELEPLPPAQADSVQQILNAGRHLLQMINEVLDIARIDAGQMALSLEPVDSAIVIRQVSDLMRPLAVKCDVSISVELSLGGTYVLADASRLKQVLLNLVDNAVKYNRPEGSVRVTTARVGDRLRLSVIDSGPGIPTSKRHHLFVPFERLGAEMTAVEGTGLGLAVTTRLAAAMGGTIGFESVEGDGSTFWIELPAALPPAPAPQDAFQPATVLRPDASATGTVLYVEDNPSNTRLMERLMKARPGVRLIVAHDGATGLSLARSEMPDLILLDLHLPDLHGEQVLARILADPTTAGIPVAILSADATQNHVDRLLASGAATYITKPFAIPDLLGLVDRFLAGRKQTTS